MSARLAFGQSRLWPLARVGGSTCRIAADQPCLDGARAANVSLRARHRSMKSRLIAAQG